MMESSRASQVIVLAGVLALGFLMGYVFRGDRRQSSQPQKAVSPPKMTIPADQPVIGFLNQVNGQPAVTVTEGGTVSVSGWAGCANASSPLVNVEILVAGRPMATM